MLEGNRFYGPVFAGAVVQVGGSFDTAPGTGAGNVFYPDLYSPIVAAELTISGNAAVVQGNLFEPTEQPAIEVDAADVTIGAENPSYGNLIESTATDPVRHTVDAAIVLNGNDIVVENNTLTKNGGWGGVEVDNGNGNTITSNQMTGNTFGIEFANLGYVYDTDITKNPSGPNDLEYYPILQSTSSTPSGTTVTGRIEQAGSLTLDFYSQASCGLQAESPGQGAMFLGSTTVSSTLGGEPFSFTGTAIASGQTAITATATASDGSTSEFSPCLLTDSHAPQLLGFGVRSPASTVPITVTAAASRFSPAASSGKGTLWLLCPANTPGSCRGTEVIKTTGTTPTTVSSQTITIVAGSAAKIIVQVSGALLTQLESAHKLAVTLSTSAKDGATPPNSQTYQQALTLTYA